jgi:hypothetical protein
MAERPWTAAEQSEASAVSSKLSRESLVDMMVNRYFADVDRKEHGGSNAVTA